MMISVGKWGFRGEVDDGHVEKRVEISCQQD